MPDMSEKGFETLIVSYLKDIQGYEVGNTLSFNPDTAIDEMRVEQFLRATQMDEVENSMAFNDSRERKKFFSKLSSHIGQKGVVEVLRKGFKYNSANFDMMKHLPSALNPSAEQDFQKNIFSISRQVHFSSYNPMLSLDLVLFINGLPVITFELKNSLTKQTVKDAVKQYQNEKDRNPKELIFNFKRCAVHFAVDDSEVMMCTKLEGKNSWFLPFNKGTEEGGSGNPVNPNGLKTAYLWEDILSKKSLSNIVENYAQVVAKIKYIKDPKTKKRTQKTEYVNVWPRYHQLRVVEKLLEHTRENPLGQKYLIQHSAGSGKSNSITWLAYHLVPILDGNKNKFDSVIVVTDRKNLDKQIRDNIKAFNQLPNIVAWADSSSTLSTSLKKGVKIVVTTIHKFPEIYHTIGSELKNKNFAIIIDEAHSSQNGTMSAKMSLALSGNANKDKNEIVKEEDIEDKVNNTIEGRRLLKNANYYAFTATPKPKTSEIFGIRIPNPNPEGEDNFVPFDNYSMRQAIEEHFILDVLKYYTPYKSYYSIIKTAQDDPEYEKQIANKRLKRFVEVQPTAISTKAKIIVEHFIDNVACKIKGQARAMVVCADIERAIRYYYEIKKLLEQYKSPYKAVIAFSGDKTLESKEGETYEYYGKELNEASINGFPSNEIEDNMKVDPYRILVVADKFQTGYDEPLLHTMYVDKMLYDIQAVQTLSRLNRCHPDKKDTFVLDFYNEPESIQESFQRYYKTTVLQGETDRNELNNKIDAIDSYQIYSNEEVEEFIKIFFTECDRTHLDPILDECVERFKTYLNDKDKAICKKSIRKYLQLYPFLALIMEFGKSKTRSEWEKKYDFYLYLYQKLPRIAGVDDEDIIKDVDFDEYRIQKRDELHLELQNEDGELAPATYNVTDSDAEYDYLSNIVNEFNQRWGDKFSNPKQVEETLKSLPNLLLAKESFKNASINSDEETALSQAKDDIMEIILDIMEVNQQFPSFYLQNNEFKDYVNNLVFNIAYKSVFKSETESSGYIQAAEPKSIDWCK